MWRSLFACMLGLAVWVATERAAAGSERANAEAGAIPADVVAILPWFPADTETLIVARDVALSTDTLKRKSEAAQKTTADQTRALREMMLTWLAKSVAPGRLLTLGGANLLETGKNLQTLGDTPAQLVVYGGRDYQVVSAFGTFRWHGASVVVFAEEANDRVARFLEEIRGAAAKTRRVRGREVLCFPADKGEMENVYHVEPWQGTFIVPIRPNVVLCATSEIYLDEMLARVDSNPTGRAMPADLPEWKYVDTTSSVWGLRHIPPAKGQKVQGVVWQGEPGGRTMFEIFYLPSAGANVRPLAERWFATFDKDGKTSIAADAEEAIRTLPDGTVVVSFALDRNGTKNFFPFFHMYHLQGQQPTW